MSTAVFPSATALPGVTYNVKRTPKFQTRTQVAISGKETRFADWSVGRYDYQLQFEFLRTDAVHQELQRLAAFYLNRRGMFDSFLFDDVDDNSVTNQAIAIGDGVKTQFQLQRSYGVGGTPLWTEPVLAPNVVSAVFINGVPQTPGTNYSIGNWENGVTPPGTLAFTAPPANGAAITATFTYFWPCRFLEDTLELTKFMQTLWLAQSVKFTTIK